MLKNNPQYFLDFFKSLEKTVQKNVAIQKEIAGEELNTDIETFNIEYT